MSFWKGVKNAFGFGGSESEEDIEEYDSSLPTYAAQSNHSDHEPTHHQPDTVPQAQPQPDALASTAATDFFEDFQLKTLSSFDCFFIFNL